MAKCGINNIRFGDKQVPAPRVVAALDSAKGIQDLDTAIAKSYDAIKSTGISYKAWDTWFRKFQQPSTTKNIKASELSNHPGTHAERVAKLLNLAEHEATSNYEVGNYAKRVFNRVKSNLLQRGKGLTDDEIITLERSLKAILTKDRMMQDVYKLRTQARKNLKTKFAENTQLRKLVAQFLEANPEKIPADKVELHRNLLSEFGQRTSELNFREIGEIYKDLHTFMDGLEDDVFAKKEETDPGDIDTTTLAQQIKSKTIDLSKIENPFSREDLKAFSKFTEADLARLDPQLLSKVSQAIDNANNGIGVSKSIRTAVVEMEAYKQGTRSNAVVAKTNKTTWKNFVSRMYGKVKSKVRGKESAGQIAEIIRANPLSSIDEMFGSKGKIVQNATLGKQASKYATYKAKLRGLVITLNNAEAKLEKKYKKGNDFAQAKFEVTYAQLAREFEANDGDGIASPEAFLDATIDKIKRGNVSNGYDDETIAVFEKIKKKFSGMSAAQVMKALSKEQVELMNTLDEQNKNSVDMVSYLAGTVRGESVTMYDFYVAHNVIENSEAEQNAAAQRKVNFLSAKASATKERTEGAKAIAWDPIYNTEKSAGAVLLDFHMTPVNQEVLKTLDNITELAKDGTKEHRLAAAALSATVKEVMENVYTAASSERTAADDLISDIKSYGYLATLASAPRFIAEFVSNAAFALLGAPSEFLSGSGKFRNVSAKAGFVNILTNLGSSQTDKLTEKGVTGSKHVDDSLTQKRRKETKVLSPAEEKIRNLKNTLGRVTGAGVARRAVLGFMEQAISTPDRVISRPVWVGAFAKKFKQKTGQDPDFDKIEANDAAYMEKYEDVLKVSRLAADDMSILSGATNNPFSSIIKLQIKGDKRGASNVYREISGYLQRFLLFEYSTAKTAVMSMMGNGYLSKRQGAGMLAGAVARMSLYGVVMSYMGQVMAEALGYGSTEDDDEDYAEMMKNDVIGSMLALFFGRNFTNIPKIPLNFAIEAVNQQIHGDDYDGYKDSLVWSQLGQQDFRRGKGLADWLAKIAGPYGPALKGGEKVWKDVALYFNTKDKKKQAELGKDAAVQSALQFLGHAGLIPMFKDVNKLYQQEKRNERSRKKKKAKGLSGELDLNLDLDLGLDLDL